MLVRLRDLGVDIPSPYIEKTSEYLANIVTTNGSRWQNDPNYRAEVFLALASLGNPFADSLASQIDSSALGRHGIIAYVFGLHMLGQEVGDEMIGQIEKKIREDDTPYLYWSAYADQAFYAEFLIKIGKMSDASKILERLLSEMNVASRYVSTIENVALLRAISLYAKMVPQREQTVSFSA